MKENEEYNEQEEKPVKGTFAGFAQSVAEGRGHGMPYFWVFALAVCSGVFFMASLYVGHKITIDGQAQFKSNIQVQQVVPANLETQHVPAAKPTSENKAATEKTDKQIGEMADSLNKTAKNMGDVANSIGKTKEDILTSFDKKMQTVNEQLNKVQLAISENKTQDPTVAKKLDDLSKSIEVALAGKPNTVQKLDLDPLRGELQQIKDRISALSEIKTKVKTEEPKTPTLGDDFPKAK